MAQTTWHPKLDLSGRAFILSNGEIIKSPDLEETASGRKVRLAGTDISMWSKEADDLISLGAQRAAAERNTTVWMVADHKHQARNRSLCFDPATQPSSQWAFDESNHARSTNVWYRFTHPTLPIEAVLVLKLARRSGNTTEVYVHSLLHWQYADPNDVPLEPSWVADHARPFTRVYSNLPSRDDEAWSTFVGATPASFDEDLLIGETRMDERRGVREFAKRLRLAEQLTEIQIPDLRNEEGKTGYERQFSWLTLKLDSTNSSGRLSSSIADYLDNDATEEEIKDAVVNLRASFRRLGLILEDRDNHILAAAQAADHEALTFKITSGTINEEGTVDHAHHVAIHLPTGSIVVTCQHQLTGQIANAWDEGRIVAELTGNLDAWLGHAAEFTEKTHRKKARNAIKVRDVVETS